MGTFDVTLPRTQKIVFPARCVVCEAENPGTIVNLSFLGVDDSLFYSANSLDKIDGVPACQGCAPRLKRYHRLLKVSYYTMPVLGLIPLFFLRASLIIGIPVAIVGACSPGVFTLLVPPAFGATFYADKANFEFRSKKVAEEFAQLNE